MDITNQLYDVVSIEEGDPRRYTAHPYNTEYVGADNMKASPELVADIAENGIANKPRILRTPDGVDYILDGHRRIDGAIQLGAKTILVEIVVPRPGVDVKRIIRTGNKYRDRNERMRNIEAVALLEDLEQSTKLRKLKNLKGVYSAIEIGDSDQTMNDVAKYVGESVATLKLRKLVHYQPVMNAFWKTVNIPTARRDEIEPMREKCSRRWLEIREANNSEEISISRAAEMVRALQEEIRQRASGKKQKVKTGPAKTKVKAEKAEQPKVGEVDLTFSSRPNGLIWIAVSNGYKFGIVSEIGEFVPAYESPEGELIRLDWDDIVQPTAN